MIHSIDKNKDSELLDGNTEVNEDNDSGMSSEENDESLKLILSNNNNNFNVSSIVDKQEVITKCLTKEPQCAEHWNEIPSCSNDLKNVSVIIDKENNRSILDHSDDLVIENRVSDYIVIDLTCDVENVRELNKSERQMLGTNVCNVDSEYLNVPDAGTSQSLVPVAHNELVKTENQKLLSLSLSILLAALLQAMRCFAQFLEDIVVPQR